MSRFRPRVTYANVVSTLCLFLLLGGGAYAAATIGASDIKTDAVRSRHIKNGEVQDPDLARNSVGSAKVRDGSLLARDFKPGQLPPRVRGSFSYNRHVKVDTFDVTLAKVNGMTVSGLCVGPGSGPEPSNYVQVTVSSSDSKRTLFISGITAEDGTLHHIDTTALAKGVAGSANADFDGIATVGEGSTTRWTRFDLGSYYGGTGGCNFWGLIAPPSN